MTMACRAIGIFSIGRKTAVLSSLFLVIMFIPRVGQATPCYWGTNDFISWPTTPDPWYLNFAFPATITVPRTASSGEVIATSTVMAYSKGKGVTCLFSFRSHVASYLPVDSSNGYLLQSGVSGIGLKAERTSYPKSGFKWDRDQMY